MVAGALVGLSVVDDVPGRAGCVIFLSRVFIYAYVCLMVHARRHCDAKRRQRAPAREVRLPLRRCVPARRAQVRPLLGRGLLSLAAAARACAAARARRRRARHCGAAAAAPQASL